MALQLTISTSKLIAAELVRVVAIKVRFGVIELTVELVPQITVLFLQFAHLVPNTNTNTPIKTLSTCD